MNLKTTKMDKKIIFGKEARAKVLQGVKTIAGAIKVTLGPTGKCVLISQGFVADYSVQHLPIHVSKDGYTVARSIQLTDSLENIGAMIIKEAAQKTVDQAGDATTCTTVLAEAIIEGGVKLIEEGANSQELKKGIDAAVLHIVEELKKMATPVGDGVENIRRIATVSANNDSEIGDLIADAFEQIGKDGIIDIEEAKTVKTEINITNGFKFDSGYLSPIFITNQAKGEVEFTDPYIFLYDKNISLMKQITGIIEKVVQKQKPLVIICDDMDGEALAFLAVNAAQKKFPSCVVRCPFLFENKREMMEDIAALTGGDYVGDLMGVAIENVEIDNLGIAKKVIITKGTTTIIGGRKGGSYTDLLNELRMNLHSKEDEQQRIAAEFRIARLTSGVAVISVGAPTQTEMKEKKDRVDDSIRATKAAIAEGFVPGGGTAFAKIARGLVPKGLTKDRLQGFVLTMSAIVSPFKQICINSEVSVEAKYKETFESGGGPNVGYNAMTDTVEDLVETGIIDPVKALRCALINAASVSGMVLTCEAIVCDSLN